MTIADDMKVLREVISHFREGVADLIDPEGAADRRRYRELLNRLGDLYRVCGYNFPTTKLVVEWLLAGRLDEPGPTVEQVRRWLERELEAPELVERLRATLNDGVGRHLS